MTATPRWHRVLLKVSGEAFGGSSGRPIDAGGIATLVDEIAMAHEAGVQIAVVNGGGNILRGAQNDIAGLKRTTADTMGMLATIINALSLADLLRARGIEARVQTSIAMHEVAEPYIRGRAKRHLEKGRVVILAGGTGHPFFSTDTTAALRGSEIEADVILKGTKVDGVYDRDPMVHKEAKRFDHLTYTQVLDKRLHVMDRTAITLCEENGLPIVVFKMGGGNLLRLLQSEEVGTVVDAAPAS